jgi:kinesin family protein 20
LKNDGEGGGKYVAGLREVRCRSREEAHSLIRQGLANRQVFGTLANSTSSRSHGVFTIRIVRIHDGAPSDLSSITSSRLSIIDLAGSERTKHTATTGDRLKEAGNINKSLMVLGQCMEVMNANQKAVAGGRGKRLGVVPFRHSKLVGYLFLDERLRVKEGWKLIALLAFRRPLDRDVPGLLRRRWQGCHDDPRQSFRYRYASLFSPPPLSCFD